MLRKVVRKANRVTRATLVSIFCFFVDLPKIRSIDQQVPRRQSGDGTAVFINEGYWNRSEHLILFVLRRQYSRVIAIGSYNLVERLFLSIFGVETRSLSSILTAGVSSDGGHGKLEAGMIPDMPDEEEVKSLITATVSRRSRRLKDQWGEGEEANAKHMLRASPGVVKAWSRFLDEKQVSLLIYYDAAYFPIGLFVRSTLKRGVECLNFNAAHVNNAFVLRCVDEVSVNQHHLKMPAGYLDRQRSLFEKEWVTQTYEHLKECYDSRSWYSECGTLTGTQLGQQPDLRAELLHGRQQDRLGIIFSHIFWDDTTGQGTNVYENYGKALRKAVDYAALNPNVHWIVKLHPALKTKNIRDGLGKEHSPERDLISAIVDKADNIELLDLDWTGQSFDLIEASDFVVTVRGTVALEAGLLGKFAICAGSSNYSGAEFVFEATSDEEFRTLMTRAHGLEPDVAMGIRDAAIISRWQYLQKPFSFNAITCRYQHDLFAKLKVDYQERLPEAFIADLHRMRGFLESDDTHLIA